MNFTDINAKLRYKISGSDMVDISFFAARDNLAISRLMSMRLGNLAGSANWYSSCGDNWHFTTTAAISNYTTRMVMDLMDCSQEMSEYIRSFALNESAGYEISDGHSLNLGFRSELLRVKSGDMSANGSRQYEIRSGWQNALWLGYDGTLSSRFSVSAGVRLSAFSALTAGSFYKIFVYNEAVPESGNKTYTNLEPRGSIKFSINDCHSLRAGASLSTQNLHGIRSTSTTFPFDRYALTSSWVRPERGTQYSAGYTGMTAAGEWDWSLEAYYKSMRNVYDYRDGMSMFSRVCLENSILGGKGRSYGLELMLRKNTGRLTGWISYTLSKPKLKFPASIMTNGIMHQTTAGTMSRW